MNAIADASVESAPAETWVEIVRRRASSMRYGSVQITIHDGRVTLVESTEKTRLPSEPRGSGDRN